jgi:hypothetical protein
MNHQFDENKPRFYRLGRPCLTATGIADPSLTIVEVDESTGILLAEACHEDALARFHLESVTWLRLMGPFFEAVPTQTFEDVLLHRHRSGLFVAQDTRSEKLLPHPSTTPYLVIFLTQEEYQSMERQFEDPSAEESAGIVQAKAQALPGFQMDGWKISAPDDYASADVTQVEAEMLDTW